MMQREPVMIWGSLGLLVGLVLRYFVPEVTDEFINLLIEVVSVAGPTVMGLAYARAQVTPLASPRDAEGTSLRPVVE